MPEKFNAAAAANFFSERSNMLADDGVTTTTTTTTTHSGNIECNSPPSNNKDGGDDDEEAKAHLRNDSATLLQSLHKHQSTIVAMLSKLKSEQQQQQQQQQVQYGPALKNRRGDYYGDDEDECNEMDANTDDDDDDGVSRNHGRRDERSRRWQQEQQQCRRQIEPPHASSLSVDRYYRAMSASSAHSKSQQQQQQPSKSANKTVSFSDYLRTSGGASPRRLSRSASPFKSILKKQQQQQQQQQTVTSLRSSLASGLSMTTNSLLSLDRYDLDERDDFETNMRDMMRCGTYSSSSHTHRSSVDDSAAIIEYIGEKRQAYLNHTYNKTNGSNGSLAAAVVVVDNNNTESAAGRPSSCKKLKMSTNPAANRHQLERSNSVDSSMKTPPPPTKMPIKKIVIKKPKSVKPCLDKNKGYKTIAKIMKRNKPLLGYDWALDNLNTKLNTTQTKFDKPDEYWQELSTFRRHNEFECMSAKSVNFDGTISNLLACTDMDASLLHNYTGGGGGNRSTSRLHQQQQKTATCCDEGDDDADDDGYDARNHKCIYSYTLNERLFPVPVYKDKNGQSACPVCKSTRKEATNYSPQFCKISIPKSRMYEPYKPEVIKRLQVNPQDTLSLADHCFAGYENAPAKGTTSYNMPKSRTVDLRSATGLDAQISKLTIDDVKRITTNKDPSTAGLYNKAHAMRFDLEDQHQKRLRQLMHNFDTEQHTSKQ